MGRDGSSGAIDAALRAATRNQRWGLRPLPTTLPPTKPSGMPGFRQGSRAIPDARSACGLQEGGRGTLIPPLGW